MNRIDALNYLQLYIEMAKIDPDTVEGKKVLEVEEFAKRAILAWDEVLFKYLVDSRFILYGDPPSEIRDALLVQMDLLIKKYYEIVYYIESGVKI